MNSLTAIAAVFALVAWTPSATAAVAPRSAHEAHSARAAPKIGLAPQQGEAFRAFRDSYRPEMQEQVHIEQHVIIRLVPSPPSVRREMLDPPSADGPVRYKEKKFKRCVAIDDIAGIAPLESNRLLLFMRDHRLLSVALERVCDADAFYLGAYVDRSADGRLCSGRDTLRARTGATCQISRINRLVALKD
jgi:hypothetical protein